VCESGAIARRTLAHALPLHGVEGLHNMPRPQQPFPVHVRTGWIDYSPALHSYASLQVARTLGGFASRIRSVTVRIADHEPHDTASRLCAIDAELKPAGALSTTASGRDPYELVERAAAAMRARLRDERRAGVPRPLSRIA
jgi:hypothetical protein